MSPDNSLPKLIFLFIGVSVLIMGIALVCIPPALFPDPANGFQVLRSMHLGGGFNNMVAPDQTDISQDYTEFLTWWSPGQYLIPYFFKIITGLNLGRGIAISVILSSISGLAGFYYFFKRLGFTPLINALSLLFIFLQVSFFVPYIFYNGGEILLFAFVGWFLYGCAAIDQPGIKLVIFVLLSGWLGFFLKSSFVWMYIAGMACIWIRLSGPGIASWVKSALWIAVPAIISIACIYTFFLAKGQSPASAAHGFSITAETFSFPLASPMLSAFSIDDLARGLIYHFGHPFLPEPVNLAILFLSMLISILVIAGIVRLVPNKAYRLFLVVFYIVAFLFFSFSYIRQLNISYEARHYRVLGILIIPGVLALLSRSAMIGKLLFGLAWAGITLFSVHYLLKGFQVQSLAARGVTGIAQPNIDQASLNKVLHLDSISKGAIFAFVSNDTGLEILHNRIISLPALNNNPEITIDDYTYDGFSGQLYIVLPKAYSGANAQFIMRSFPKYTAWSTTMLSKNYVLYASGTMRDLIPAKK